MRSPRQSFAGIKRQLSRFIVQHSFTVGCPIPTRLRQHAACPSTPPAPFQHCCCNISPGQSPEKYSAEKGRINYCPATTPPGEAAISLLKWLMHSLYTLKCVTQEKTPVACQAETIPGRTGGFMLDVSASSIHVSTQERVSVAGFHLF